MAMLEIKNLHASVDGKRILKGVNLDVDTNEIHALMGPNGAGKSTLGYVLMGHPGYTVDKGDIAFDGQSIIGMPADERARKGLFLAFQYPMSVPGVTLSNFLRTAVTAVKYHNVKPANNMQKPIMPLMEFRQLLKEKMEMLEFSPEFAERYLNDGFSGGEKKRCEIIQMAMLEPKIAVLDETDSGLDIDALKIVARGINRLTGPRMGALVITHYNRILNYIKPQHVHVFIDGRVALSGGEELANKLEEKGYDWLKASPGLSIVN